MFTISSHDQYGQIQLLCWTPNQGAAIHIAENLQIFYGDGEVSWKEEDWTNRCQVCTLECPNGEHGPCMSDEQRRAWLSRLNDEYGQPTEPGISATEMRISGQRKRNKGRK